MALGVSPVISNIAGYAFGFILGFLLSKKIVFQSNGRFVSESIRYLVAFVLSFILNLAVLQFALIYLKFNSIVSQLLASISYTLLMYLLSRIYIFKNLN
jgi:putative flippase GtrA